jgi:hypothetical protein
MKVISIKYMMNNGKLRIVSDMKLLEFVLELTLHMDLRQCT